MTTRTFMGATSTDFSTAGNWNPGDSAPQTGDVVVIANALVTFQGYNTMLFNETLDVTNSTVSDDASYMLFPNCDVYFENGTTLNLSGTNDIHLFIISSGAITINQASDGNTSFSKLLFNFYGTMTLNGGSFSGSFTAPAPIVFDADVNNGTADLITIGQGSSIELSSGHSLSSKIDFYGQNSRLIVDSGSAATGTLEQFQSDSSIVLKGQSYSNYSYVGSTLTIGPYSFVDADGRGQSFLLTHSGADTIVTVACFLEGTRIGTPHGHVAVEKLSIGMEVRTGAGAVRPIRWIGFRTYTSRFAASNPGLHPILFSANSLGDGIPTRDLYVSSEHAMFLDGVLIAARLLVNGTTIRSAHNGGPIRYFHIELDSHDIIYAEGAATETFLDDDSRHTFHNEAEFHALYPSPQSNGGFCAPIIENGFKLETIHNSISTRTASRLLEQA